MAEKEQVGPCTPFFIVADLSRSIDYYVERLGFECRLKAPHDDPFFAIVGRASAQIILKVIGEDVPPLPNHRRHEWARWDAFIYAADPDALAREFADRNMSFHQPLEDTDDGLRGFEIMDADGYVCFFGRPL